MATRYERFNEITFEAYCRAAIDKSTLKERLKKAARTQWEKPFSAFPDAAVQAFALEDTEINRIETESMTFQILGEKIQVNDAKLGQALLSLLPREREIIMLRYFVCLKDTEIARRLTMSRATVQRRRKKAEMKLRMFMEDSP